MALFGRQAARQNHLILKNRKLESVGGGVDRQSTLRGSTVNIEVINTVDPGGWGVDQQSM